MDMRAPFGAQLSTDQKVADFRHLAALYAKQYAPYEWKRDTQGFDLLNITPWLERIRSARDDLDFYEICVDYVASLDDAHDAYSLPSTYLATLNFAVDIYDGKALIDSITRSRLPVADYPFEIGDELVSVDGKTAEELIQEFTRYAVAANPLSTRRNAAGRISTRPQSRMPRAIELSESANVVVRRQSGAIETYSIRWTKSGNPLTFVGPAPSPKGGRLATENNSFDLPDILRQLQNCLIPVDWTVLGVGARNPIFAMPPGFVRRLGQNAGDFFFSGTFEAEGRRIGFIRIPSYAPPDPAAALDQFRVEIAFFQENTDGLIVDEMRNPGGQVGFTNQLAQLLIPDRFRSIGFEIRATSFFVAAFSSALESLRAQGAPQNVLALVEVLLRDVQTANLENRGRTGPLPLDELTIDRDPARDSRGRLIAYTKPLMVLVDEFSASGADLFAATIQDNRRGPLFGNRTMGAGGSVASFAVGAYSEGSASLTQTLMSRNAVRGSPGFPASPYIENVGVQPDIFGDYMTRENLLRNGRPFVEAFIAAMLNHIAASGKP